MRRDAFHNQSGDEIGGRHILQEIAHAVPRYPYVDIHLELASVTVVLYCCTDCDCCI